jgi:hypothetical protein
MKESFHRRHLLLPPSKVIGMLPSPSLNSRDCDWVVLTRSPKNFFPAGTWQCSNNSHAKGLRKPMSLERLESARDEVRDSSCVRNLSRGMLRKVRRPSDCQVELQATRVCL